jgi:hypothetical protein
MQTSRLLNKRLDKMFQFLESLSSKIKINVHLFLSRSLEFLDKPQIFFCDAIQYNQITPILYYFRK